LSLLPSPPWPARRREDNIATTQKKRKKTAALLEEAVARRFKIASNLWRRKSNTGNPIEFRI
jgi:hypothetical protein